MRNPWRGRRIAGTRRRQLEFGLVVVSASLLIGLLTVRIPPLLVAVERVSVLTTLSQLRSALGAEVMNRVADDHVRSVAELAGANPAELFPGLPDSYEGTVQAHGTPLRAGYWYFDRETGYLRYKVRNEDAFWSAGAPEDEVQVRIVLVHTELDGNRRYDGPPENISGIKLQARYEYCWCDPGDEVQTEWQQ